jgi:transcriptional regulator with XRE-family HTH domain
MDMKTRTELRRRAGLTLFELGRRVKKSAGTLSQWERGQIELSEKDVDKIAWAIEKELNRVSLPCTRETITNALTGVETPA